MDKKPNKEEQDLIDLLAGKDQSKKKEESNEDYIRRLIQEEQKKKETEVKKLKKTLQNQEIEKEKNVQEPDPMKQSSTGTVTESIAKPLKKKKRQKDALVEVRVDLTRAIDQKGETLENFLMESEKGTKKKVTFFVSLFFAFLLLMLPMMAGFEKVMHFMAKERFTAPGEVVELGDKSLHMNRMGSGEKVIVLESDIGMSSFALYSLQKELSKYATVLTYDRAGYGWSGEDADGKNTKEMAKDLHALLEKEGIEKPITLIGVKHGSNFAELFYQEYKEKVENIVLIDPVPIDFFDTSREVNGKIDLLQKMKNNYQKKSALATFGYYRLFSGEGLNDVPNDLQEVEKEIGLVPSVFRASKRELDVLEREKDTLNNVSFDVPFSIIVFDQKENYQQYGYSGKEEAKLIELKDNLQAELMLQSGENEISVLEMKTNVLDGKNEELIQIILNSMKK